MSNKSEADALAKRLNVPIEYAESMLKWKEDYEQRKTDIAPTAAAIGLTPEEYINQQEQFKANLDFFSMKGFDPTTQEGLREIKGWLQTADPDDLMLGAPTGDPFDIQMGNLRRDMLMDTVEKALKKYQLS